MNATHVQKMIRQAKGDRSIRALAADWKIDHAHLFRMMNGDRPPSDEVLYRLGLYPELVYRKKKSK